MSWWAWTLVGAWVGWSAGYLHGAWVSCRPKKAGGFHVYAPGKEDHPEDCECRWYPPGSVADGDAGRVLAKGWMRKTSEECPAHGRNA